MRTRSALQTAELAKAATLSDEEIEKLVAEHSQARKARDFARSDAIRAQLAENGVILENTKDGVQVEEEVDEVTVASGQWPVVSEDTRLFIEMSSPSERSENRADPTPSSILFVVTRGPSTRGGQLNAALRSG